MGYHPVDTTDSPSTPSSLLGVVGVGPPDVSGDGIETQSDAGLVWLDERPPRSHGHTREDLCGRTGGSRIPYPCPVSRARMLPIRCTENHPGNVGHPFGRADDPCLVPVGKRSPTPRTPLRSSRSHPSRLTDNSPSGGCRQNGSDQLLDFRAQGQGPVCLGDTRLPYRGPVPDTRVRGRLPSDYLN